MENERDWETRRRLFDLFCLMPTVVMWEQREGHTFFEAGVMRPNAAKLFWICEAVAEAAPIGVENGGSDGVLVGDGLKMGKFQ